MEPRRTPLLRAYSGLPLPQTIIVPRARRQCPAPTYLPIPPLARDAERLVAVLSAHVTKGVELYVEVEGRAAGGAARRRRR
jgi:hypothetical protein